MEIKARPHFRLGRQRNHLGGAELGGWTVAFSPDGKRLVSASWNRATRHAPMTASFLVCEIPFSDVVRPIALARDGRLSARLMTARSTVFSCPNLSSVPLGRLSDVSAQPFPGPLIGFQMPPGR